jgi:hypothetical protein
MDVWIESGDHAESEGSGCRFVFNLHEATTMSERDALEVIRGAGHVRPQYAWDLVYTSADDKFLVKGREK